MQAIRVRFIPANIYTDVDPNAGKPDQDQPTTSIDEFIANWDSRLRVIGRGSGFFGQDLDDELQIIYTLFWSRNLLHRYDRRMNVPFASFIRGYVRYLFMKARARVYSKKREITSDLLDTAWAINSGGASDDDPAEPISAIAPGGVLDAQTEQYLDIIEVNQVLSETLSELRKLPSTRTKNFARLFFDMVEQIADAGRVNQEELAQKYGYSRQAVQQHVRDLLNMPLMHNLKEELLGSLVA